MKSSTLNYPKVIHFKWQLLTIHSKSTSSLLSFTFLLHEHLWGSLMIANIETKLKKFIEISLKINIKDYFLVHSHLKTFLF